jgi:hypothetical protein
MISDLHDEVLRLRAELAAANEAAEDAGGIIFALSMENGKLRELLREKQEFHGKPMKGEWVDGGASYRLACDLYARVDAALKGGRK